MHMAYTIYFSSHLTIPSSSSHFQSSHVSSIFSGSSAFFHLFSPLIPLLFLLYFLSHTDCASCLQLVLFLSFFFPFFFISSIEDPVAMIFFSFYFLRGKKSQNVCRSNLWIRPEFTEINQNVRNTPEMTEIFSEVEQKGISFRFANWYKIFRTMV